MQKYAFLFPGQGAQSPGMIKDISESNKSAADCLENISSITGEDITKLLWESELDILSRSDRSQLAITSASLATIAALESKGIKPSVCMGFSLGEFPALYASGVLSFDDVIRVVKQRGEIMQSICDKIAASSGGNPPGMAAVIGLSPEQVYEAIKNIEGAYPANLNSPVQTVVAGTAEGLTACEQACKTAGARRVLRLKVAGPFHSPLMSEAAQKFEDFLKSITFNDPKITLFSNVTGKKVLSGEEAKKSAVLHLTNPVRWTDEEDALGDLISRTENATDWNLVEVGPGNVLTGLWQKSKVAEVASAYPCSNQTELEALCC